MECLKERAQSCAEIRKGTWAGKRKTGTTTSSATTTGWYAEANAPATTAAVSAATTAKSTATIPPATNAHNAAGHGHHE